jgi:hypothetical protein
MAGQSFAGSTGYGSQFMPTQKFCNRRIKTLVLTVFALATFSSWSARVSSKTSSKMGSLASSLANVSQRKRISLPSGLLSITAFSAPPHVLAADLERGPARLHQDAG